MVKCEKIAIIGLGYIGLPTATAFAGRGLNVIGVDINQYAVDMINKGQVHIVEPGLGELVHNVVKAGKLRAQTKPAEADVYIIAVPTPFKENHEPDLSYIKATAKAIAPFLRRHNLVILESTSPVGTTEQLAQWLAEERPELKFRPEGNEEPDIHLAYCPERVLPGRILEELVGNDRIIGGMSPMASQRAAELYKTFVKGECLLTNCRTAEMAKLTENSFRDVNIAFANELSLICDQLQINVWELIKLANRHPRVNILQPGPGVGGHCIAVDPWFIVHSAPERSRLIRAAREVNDTKPHYVVDKILECASRMSKPAIACLGLAFKADIDDLRESPSVEIVQMLAQRCEWDILAVEPNVKTLPKVLANIKNIHLVSLSEALAAANIVALLVNHRDFDSISITQLAGKKIIDTRGVLQ